MQRFNTQSGKELILINIHNSAFDKGDLRKIQIETLRQVALKEYGKGNWVIIGGDWNMNPPGFDPDKITTGDETFTVETEKKFQMIFLPKGWKWIYDEKKGLQTVLWLQAILKEKPPNNYY